MDRRKLAACSLLVCLAACLENEEEITIRPDGSALVRYRVSGDLRDLAEGYPLPPSPVWRLVEGAFEGEPAVAGSATTPRWQGELGRADLDALLTSVAARTGAAQRIDPSRKAEVVFEAELGSARDLTRHFAPASEPYASAYLAHAQVFWTRPRGAGEVFFFERTYPARVHARYDVWARLQEAVPAELIERLDDASPLTEAERAQIAEQASNAMRDATLALADDALLSDFTDDSLLRDPLAAGASLSAAAVGSVRAAVADELARCITTQRIRTILDLVKPPAGKDPAAEEHGEARLKELEQETRATLRSALGRALAAARVPPENENAIRAQLEWLLCAYDHTVDLGDETFEVVVRLPGTVVGGNYDSCAEGAARWRFSGEDLRDRERVLRVVSVLEATDRR